MKYCYILNPEGTNAKDDKLWSFKMPETTLNM